ncbi:hypothetical protein RhiirA5_416802 [Rhizophagus irregularis]|uniref:Uncharacterized protein n=1 Tax=Rhizophagus irregularis TaxID=588596 RepID=A0A2N0PP14_9GLOM|nr:hypothetical protein RhiirA5_416802 [Rhizophagus irregularis]GET51913.1 hypothetical protein GLOIN_2v1767687 [Rhizophagus irregularis DAOM 181602=DAOM 197198]
MGSSIYNWKVTPFNKEQSEEAMHINKNGFDGKSRILSIIAKKFTYDEIKSQLNVSNDAIRYAQNHAGI